MHLTLLNHRVNRCGFICNLYWPNSTSFFNSMISIFIFRCTNPEIYENETLKTIILLTNHPEIILPTACTAKKYVAFALNNFLLLSHSSSFLSLSCLFFGNIFKVKSSFWSYHLITPLCFVVNINSCTFALSFRIKDMEHNFSIFQLSLTLKTKNRQD